jgi:putative DNA primase/helicase
VSARPESKGAAPATNEHRPETTASHDGHRDRTAEGDQRRAGRRPQADEIPREDLNLEDSIEAIRPTEHLLAVAREWDDIEPGERAARLIWLQSADMIAKLATVEPEELEAALATLATARGCADKARKIGVRVREVRKAADKAAKERAAEERRRKLAEDGDRVAGPEWHVGLDVEPEARKVPEGYSITRRGVYGIREGNEGPSTFLVAERPIVITAELVDLDSGDAASEVAWLGADGGWRKRVVSRVVPRDSRLLVSLARADQAPIASDTSRECVTFLRQYAALNGPDLPQRRLTTVLGFLSEPKDDEPLPPFVAGTAIGVPEGMAPPEVLEHDASGDRTKAAEIRSGLVEAGTWDGWCGAWTIATRNPAMALGVYAALVPVIQQMAAIPSFVVDWSGSTSTGKTVTMRLAASVWGHPWVDRPGLLGDWAGTLVAIERTAAAVGRGLPVILDDSRKLTPRDVEADKAGDVLYLLGSGRGKPRGTTGGTKQAGGWRTVGLSTGEAAITTISKTGGGAVARTLEIREAARNNNDASAIADILDAHHGHLGPRLIRALEWMTTVAWIREEYARRHAARREELRDAGEVAMRGAQYVAALDLVADLLARDSVGLPKCEAAIGLAMAAARRNGIRADRPAAALEDVAAWLAAQSHRIATHGRRYALAETPALGWVGRHGAANDRWQVGVLADALDDYLERRGYRASEVLPRWLERGWIIADKATDRLPTKRVDFDPTGGTKRPRLVCFTHGVLDGDPPPLREPGDDTDAIEAEVRHGSR